MDVLKQISEVRHLFLDSGCVVVCVLRSLVVGCLLPVLHCSMLCDLAAPHNPLCARQEGDMPPFLWHSTLKGVAMGLLET